MQATQKYNEIISAIKMDLIYLVISRKTKVGASTELNYPAISLLKDIHECLSLPELRYQTMNVGCDNEAIYKQVYRMSHQSIEIIYN